MPSKLVKAVLSMPLSYSSTLVPDVNEVAEAPNIWK